MKRIIELSENDYKALKEDGVQNHLALADSIIAHSVPYEERPTGEWVIVSNDIINHHVDCICSKCGHAGDFQDKFCRECGADMRKGEQE